MSRPPKKIILGGSVGVVGVWADTVLTLVVDSQFYLDPQSTFAQATACNPDPPAGVGAGIRLCVIL